MDGKTDGLMENLTPISHLAKAGVTKMYLDEPYLTVVPEYKLLLRQISNFRINVVG